MFFKVFGFLILSSFGLNHKGSPVKESFFSQNQLEKQKSVAFLKQKPSEQMALLIQLVHSKSSFEIHNKALQLLKTNHKTPALLLLKMNAYQNFFPPSYLTLLQLKIPFSWTPLLWHLGLFISGLICLVTFLLYFKKPKFFHLKSCIWSLALFSLIIFSGWFFLKNKVGLLQPIALKSSPFMQAPSHVQLSTHYDLLVLKQTKHWLRVQNPDKQTGWVLKTKVFQTF